jgi:hypothetical protein
MDVSRVSKFSFSAGACIASEICEILYA